MHRRFITRTAMLVSLSLPAFVVGAVSAQDAAPAAAEPAPRSLMLQPPPLPPRSAPAASHAEASKPDDKNIQRLEGVTVEGKRDVMSESDRHLKELIGGLPCTGCDTKTKKIEEKRSFTEKALKAVAKECCIPTRPPEETEANELDRQLTQQVINPTNNHP